MDIRKLQRAIVNGLEDVKAQDIVVFNTEQLSPLFERVVVASGTSNRQTKALASSVREAVKAAGGQILSVEGEDNGEWIIVDCGAAVAHIMQPAIRQYYHLEEIWGGKPVRLKLGTTGKGLVKASEPIEEEGDAADAATVKATARAPRRGASRAEAAPARKAAAKKGSGGTPARTPAVKTAGGKTPSRPAAGKKAPARKTTAPKIPVVVVGEPPARKAAGKTAGKAASKTAARKVARKAPARKTAPRA